MSNEKYRQVENCCDTIQTAAARVRRTAINVVDVSDVTTCQNMVDVSDVTTCQNMVDAINVATCQNIHVYVKLPR